MTGCRQLNLSCRILGDQLAGTGNLDADLIFVRSAEHFDTMVGAEIPTRLDNLPISIFRETTEPSFPRRFDMQQAVLCRPDKRFTNPIPSRIELL